MHRQHSHQCDISIIRPTPTRVEITLLGGFHVTVDGLSSPAHGWARRSASALVKILALAPGHRLHREKVMDLLWPDESPERSAPRLHKAAHFARRAAGRHDTVVLRDDVVWLFPNAELTVDVVEFERLARAAVGQNDTDAARVALAWYGGELLHLRRLDVLRVAAEWRELAETEPSDEEAHERLMRQHISAGDGAAAMRQYEHLQRVLERDLGVEPGPRLRAVFDDASRLTPSPDRTPSAPVDDLLAELADLVTRQSALLAELVAVGAQLPALAG